MTIKQKIQKMSVEELEDYLQHLKMLAKMEDNFLIKIAAEQDKPLHRKLYAENIELQDFTQDVLRRKTQYGI